MVSARSFSFRTQSIWYFGPRYSSQARNRTIWIQLMVNNVESSNQSFKNMRFFKDNHLLYCSISIHLIWYFLHQVTFSVCTDKNTSSLMHYYKYRFIFVPNGSCLLLAVILWCVFRASITFKTSTFSKYDSGWGIYIGLNVMHMCIDTYVGVCTRILSSYCICINYCSSVRNAQHG